MITVRNEFETVPAFTNVAGCSLGTQTARETTAEMIGVLHTVTQVHTEPFWKDLAETTDEDTQNMFEIQQEVANDLDIHMPMPQFCSVTLQDNEWTVLPQDLDNIDQDEGMTKTDELPDEYLNDFVAVVNDHGNVTMYQWEIHTGNIQFGSYKEIWAVV